jgi:hypothetical protein
VRLANPPEEDRDKVFALKVLRKADSLSSSTHKLVEVLTVMGSHQAQAG